MIDHKKIETAARVGLEYWLNAGELPLPNTEPGDWPEIERPCLLIRQDQTGEIPPYPYVTYKVTSLAGQKAGGYAVGHDGRFYGTAEQTWSLTVHSDEDDEAVALALAARDWFAAAGLVWLSDNGIAVGRLHQMNDRGSVLVTGYVYRKGFDVVLRMLDIIEATPVQRAGQIETVDWTK